MDGVATGCVDTGDTAVFGFGMRRILGSYIGVATVNTVGTWHPPGGSHDHTREATGGRDVLGHVAGEAVLVAFQQRVQVGSGACAGHPCLLEFAPARLAAVLLQPRDE